MHGQAASGEALAAGLAHKQFLNGMGPPKSGQAAALREALAACLVGKGVLAGVGPAMCGQVAVLHEALAAAETLAKEACFR